MRGAQMEPRRTMLECEMLSCIAQLRRLNLGWVANLLEAHRTTILAAVDADQAKDGTTAEGSSRILQRDGTGATVAGQERGSEMSDRRQLGIDTSVVPEEGGRKDDQGKSRFDLLPPAPLFAAADVFAFGANKYDARNWEEGIDYGRLFGALNRHLWAWWNGQDADPESEMSHLGHAMCCLMMLTEEHLNPNFSDALDDRPAPVQ